MSVTIELNLTRRWSVEAAPDYYIVVDSDADLHDSLAQLTSRTNNLQVQRYYGRLAAGIYELSPGVWER